MEAVQQRMVQAARPGARWRLGARGPLAGAGFPDLLGLLAVIGVSLAPALAAAQEGGNPHLRRAQSLYDRFQYEDALEETTRARSWPGNTRADQVSIALLEGMAAGELAQQTRALRAFEWAVALDPWCTLPEGMSPKISALFDLARRKQAVAPATRPGPSASLPGKPSPAVLITPPPGTPPPVAPRTHLTWLVGSAAVVDVLGESVGADVKAGLGYRGWEAVAGALLGKNLGVTLEAAWLLGPSAVRGRVGIRGTVFPGPPGLGAGGVAGVRVRIVSGLCVALDTAVEGFSAPTPYRRLAWLVNAGLVFDSGARPR